MTQTPRAADSGPLPPLSIRASLRYDVVRRALEEIRPRTILEIGCGQGALGARLAETSEYVGLEPDDSSFAVADSRITPRGGTVIHDTDAAIPEGQTFDLVCAFEVLEHIRYDEQALGDWSRHVTPGGHLMLSVPAFQDRFGPMDTHAGHFRRYGVEDLTAKLEGAGLVDADVTVYGWPLCYPLETLRNAIDKRKLARAGDLTPEEFSAASGRTFQPTNQVSGTLIRLGSAPFARLQRVRPKAGTGLVAVARKPAG